MIISIYDPVAKAFREVDLIPEQIKAYYKSASQAYEKLIEEGEK